MAMTERVIPATAEQEQEHERLIKQGLCQWIRQHVITNQIVSSFTVLSPQTAETGTPPVPQPCRHLGLYTYFPSFASVARLLQKLQTKFSGPAVISPARFCALFNVVTNVETTGVQQPTAALDKAEERFLASLVQDPEHVPVTTFALTHKQIIEMNNDMGPAVSGRVFDLSITTPSEDVECSLLWLFDTIYNDNNDAFKSHMWLRDLPLHSAQQLGHEMSGEMLSARQMMNELEKDQLDDWDDYLHKRAMAMSSSCDESIHLAKAPVVAQRLLLLQRERCANCCASASSECSVNEEDEKTTTSAQPPPPGRYACGGCHFIRYCSKACQKADWPKHKSMCRLSAVEYRALQELL